MQIEYGRQLTPEEILEEKIARVRLEDAIIVMDEIENNKESSYIDLNAPSTFWPGSNNGEALLTTMNSLKKGLNHLTEEERAVADDLIIRADLYLVTYKPEEKK
jgi:hypothetical protein